MSEFKISINSKLAETIAKALESTPSDLDKLDGKEDGYIYLSTFAQGDIMQQGSLLQREFSKLKRSINIFSFSHGTPPPQAKLEGKIKEMNGNSFNCLANRNFNEIMAGKLDRVFPVLPKSNAPASPPKPPKPDENFDDASTSLSGPTKTSLLQTVVKK